MRIIAIDPGPVQSAFVVWDGQTISERGIVPNNDLISTLRLGMINGSQLVIEKVASYGMAVGETVFDTVFWTGRFWEAWRGAAVRVPRLTVKTHLCHDSRAKDSNIRQAIIDRFGGKEFAIGSKKAPGPLYGLKKDLWQAFALALTWYDLRGD